MKGAEQNGDVLRWTGKLLSADDLRRHLNGHSEVILSGRTIVTPLAADELRASGIRIRREEAQVRSESMPGTSRLGVAEEKPDRLVQAALQALEREGITLAALPSCTGPLCGWARSLAECIAQGKCQGGVAFCADPGLVCCVANKLPGLRAAAVASVPQAERALANLGANLLVVEMPGRTLFEVRKILTTLARATLICPAGLACTLKELEHAHR